MRQFRLKQLDRELELPGILCARNATEVCGKSCAVRDVEIGVIERLYASALS
jgi:hypothetical protein